MNGLQSSERRMMNWIRSGRGWLPLTLVAAAVVVAAAQASAQRAVYIKAGRVITVSGADLTDATIVVKDGRITAVGTDVEVPWDAEVIDASKHVVMPGMIEAHTSRGMGTSNETVPSVPFLNARDALNAVDFYFEDRLRDGVVALNVMPGNRTLIGGQGLVVKPHGLTVEDMTVKGRSGMKLSLLPIGRDSRMSHMKKLRREFMKFSDERATEAEKRKAAVETAKAKGEDAPDEEPADPEKQPMIDLLAGKMKAFVYCGAAADVRKLVELDESFGLDVVPVLGGDSYKAAATIAARGWPVVIAPPLVRVERDEETLEETEVCTPKAFLDAGVKSVSLLTSSSALGARHLWFQAAVAIRHGVPRAEALKAITLYPATTLGIADRFGSIEVGKDANLTILTGDPFDYGTWVDRVVFEGKVIYDRADDKRIARLFAKPDPAKEKAPEKKASKETPAEKSDGAKKPASKKAAPKKSGSEKSDGDKSTGGDRA